MSKPYNTGPCIPKTFEVLLKALPSETQAAFRAEVDDIDAMRSAMDAVNQLAWFLPAVRAELPVVPIISPGIYDVDIDETYQSAIEDWLEGEPSKYGFSHLLVAGHHPDPGNDILLAPERLQSVLDEWKPGVKLVSQVLAANAPAQAAWLADQIKQLGLTAVALRTHPSHTARAFQTLLRELEKRGLDRTVVLLPWWRPCHPYREYPLTEPWEDVRYSNAFLLAGEAVRNCNYAPLDVASAGAVQGYVNWLFASSPASSVLSRACRL